MLGAGAGAATTSLWSASTPFPGACVHRKVKFAGPSGWVGKKILFITDIHYSNSFGVIDARELNRFVHECRPDAILIGGDLAQTPKTDLSGFFSTWAPSCPTFFSPGNHDVFRGKWMSPVLSQAKEAGLHILCNTDEKWDGLTFIGFPSALVGPQKYSLLDQTGLKIVMGHEPDVWDFFTQPDLLHFAGHTHGGQIKPFGQIWFLPTLGRKYVQGTFSRAQNNHLVVSAGVGYTGVDFRMNCPPEIVSVEFI